MKYGNFDYLFYGFVQGDDTIELYAIPFQRLKKWFWENYNNYPVTIINQINKTTCRVVKIEDVKRNVGFKKFIL